MGSKIILLNCGTENEVETAFAAAVQQRVAALYVGAGAFIVSRREQIAGLALRHALPTMSGTREAVAAGQALMSYGTSQVGCIGRLASMSAGSSFSKPADLPILQPTKFQLIINLKTAKALGLEIPPTLLARADRGNQGDTAARDLSRCSAARRQRAR